MTPWTQTPAKGADQIAALTAAIPQIETARLILRAPRMLDWAVLEPIWTTDRAIHIGGPMDPEEAWLDFIQCVAGWLLRGIGALTITDKMTGEVFGLGVLGHEYGDPEPELGWLLTEAAEGNGYATEAAAALRELGQQIYGDALASYVAEGNTASVRVAEKLGGRKSGTHPLDAEVGVYRYPSERNVT